MANGRNGPFAAGRWPPPIPQCRISLHRFLGLPSEWRLRTGQRQPDSPQNRGISVRTLAGDDVPDPTAGIGYIASSTWNEVDMAVHHSLPGYFP